MNNNRKKIVYPYKHIAIKISQRTISIFVGIFISDSGLQYCIYYLERQGVTDNVEWGTEGKEHIITMGGYRGEGIIAGGEGGTIARGEKGTIAKGGVLLPEEKGVLSTGEIVIGEKKGIVAKGKESIIARGKRGIVNTI